MYFLKIRYIFFCFIFLIYQSSVAQDSQIRIGSDFAYEIRHYTDENGLPQNTVKAIAPDSRGNIWLATEGGLTRFDGEHFVTIDNFGGSFLDRNISSFHINSTTGNRDFFAVNNEGTYVGIANGKAYSDTAFVSHLRSQPFYKSKGLKNYITEALPALYAKNLIIDYSIVPCGLNRYFIYDKQKVEYYVDKRKTRSFPFQSRSFWRFFRLDNDLYYLDKNSKPIRFKSGEPGSTPTEMVLAGAILNHPAYSSTQSHTIFWNNCSNQVFLLLDRSLYRLHPTKDGTLTSTLVLEGFDFKTASIKTVYMDEKTGRIFLGSLLTGLYVLKKKPFQTVTSAKPARDNAYYAQTMFSKNSIVSAQGIVFDLSSVRGKVPTHRLETIVKNVDWDQQSMLKDRHGDLWGKRDNQLFQFDHTGTILLSTWQLPGGVTQLYEGNKGRIWIGTTKHGLYYIDPAEPNPSPRFFTGKPLRNISWIQHQTPSILWIATGKGLYKIDLNGKKIYYIKGLENKYIRSLYVPQGENEVWISTYRDGIFLLKNGKLTQFPLDKMKHIASAHCIVEDKNGFFWISTNKGLFQVKKNDLLAYSKKHFDLYYYYYSKSSGFNTNEFNGGCQPCALRTGNGLVSLPSFNGLVWFVPERTRPELPNGKIYIEDLTVDGVSQNLSLNSVSLPSRRAEMSLKVNTPYFGDTYNMKIAYQIIQDGRTVSQWKSLENQNVTITTPPLEPGDYQLVIRKTNGFGPNNHSYKNLNILVQKQWYETWWLRSLLLTTVIALFYLILRQRIKAIKKQNLLLEAKVEERTRHLEQTLQILNTSEKKLAQQVRLQTRMIASITHDVRNPIRHTTAAIRHVHDLIDKKEWETAKYVTEKIGDNTDRIYQLIDNMISFIKPQVHRANADFEPTNLYTLVKERADIFKDISSGMIDINIPVDEVVNTNPKLLGVVIHNLVDNAIKAKPGNKIRIYTVRNKQQLHLLCTDQGPGIPTKLRNWLNTADANENTSLPANYEGLGLLMVKEITKILKVAVHVENNPGARIRLSFLL